MEMINGTAPDGSDLELTLDMCDSTSMVGIRTPDVEHRLILLSPREVAQLRTALDRHWDQLKGNLTPADWRNILDVV